MTLDNGKIQLSWDLAPWLLALSLRPTSWKLLISMLHQQELKSGWPVGNDRPQRCWATLAALRGRVGPKRANDARAFRQLREELLDLNVVTHCVLLPYGRGGALQWDFAPAIVADMSSRSGSAYVLLDLAELGELRTRDEIALYIHLRRAWTKQAPWIELQLSAEHGHSELRRYERVLPRLAQMLGARFHVALIYRTDAPVADRLSIKIEHAQTTWFDGALQKAPPDARRWTIGPAPDAPPT